MGELMSASRGGRRIWTAFLPSTCCPSACESRSAAGGRRQRRVSRRRSSAVCADCHGLDRSLLSDRAAAAEVHRTENPSSGQVDRRAARGGAGFHCRRAVRRSRRRHQAGRQNCRPGRISRTRLCSSNRRCPVRKGNASETAQIFRLLTGSVWGLPPATTSTPPTAPATRF